MTAICLSTPSECQAYRPGFAPSYTSLMHFSPIPAWCRPLVTVFNLPVANSCAEWIPNTPPMLDFYAPIFAVNPQLAHHRSILHPHLDWNTVVPPHQATHRHGTMSGSIIMGYHLAQYAASPVCYSMTITFAGSIAALLSRWDAIYVERRDRCPLLVGNVLHAIHNHLTKHLTHEEITGLADDEWDRAVRSFNLCVSGADRRDGGSLVLSRVDLLSGRTRFDGLHHVGGGEFLLALS
ncbi:hypothetical protein B0H10DRAFT_1937807 [Mycena sp. CBHHK59/15]|nr:hypothetical protein B0H10DRAFT_1937807 [Mycena sp. CBHHK59/15]